MEAQAGLLQLFVRLGRYMKEENSDWQEAMFAAGVQNPWFTPEFIRLAAANISECYLDEERLKNWRACYPTPALSKNVGLVLAGNIPLVGFHDLLCTLMAGHCARVKPSSRDEVLLKHFVSRLVEWGLPAHRVSFSEMLKNCDAYIATGSNNSGRYFEQYFGKYPHIIRRNRTSVAVLTGEETSGELDQLADDIQLYYGLGCRNVTRLYVPEGYDFVPLLAALRKYDYFLDNHKYRHNYDYYLALLIMNNKPYMNNGSIVLKEDPSVFSPVGQLNYSFYKSGEPPSELAENQDIQCVVGRGYLNFGNAQCPELGNYADGIDTMQFLTVLA